MRPKTFIYVLIGLALGFGLLSAFYANRELLSERFIVWSGRTIPLYAVLGVAFLIGLGLALSFTLVRESHHMLERWRQQRSQREARLVDDLYARAVEAMLDGSPAAALEKLRAVLAQQPRRVEALLKAGEILRVEDRPDEAAELHLRAHHASPEDLRPLYELVADAETRHDAAAAKRYLAQIIQLKPQSSLTAYRQLRDIHMHEEAWDQALKVQERIDKIRPVESDETLSDARIHLGIRYESAARLARLDRHRDATSRLRRLLKEHPTFVPAWRKLGELRLETENAEAGVASWVEGYRATQAPVLLQTLEDHFLASEQPERALEVFRQAVSEAEHDTVPRFLLGRLFYRLEMLDEALSELTALQDRASHAPALIYTLARILERRGRHAEANEHYRRIVREDELLSSQFKCLECGRESDTWLERCPACGQWNSLEVDFKEDVSLEELGISTAPVYTAPRS